MSETSNRDMAYNRIARNWFLYHIGIIDSPNCIYCNDEENTAHAFLTYPCIKRIWNVFAKELEYYFSNIEDIDKSKLFNILNIIPKNNLQMFIEG